jgi:hypothetical protein
MEPSSATPFHAQANSFKEADDHINNVILHYMQ